MIPLVDKNPISKEDAFTNNLIACLDSARASGVSSEYILNTFEAIKNNDPETIKVIKQRSEVKDKPKSIIKSIIKIWESIKHRT